MLRHMQNSGWIEKMEMNAWVLQLTLHCAPEPGVCDSQVMYRRQSSINWKSTCWWTENSTTFQLLSGKHSSAVSLFPLRLAWLFQQNILQPYGVQGSVFSRCSWGNNEMCCLVLCADSVKYGHYFIQIMMSRAISTSNIKYLTLHEEMVFSCENNYYSFLAGEENVHRI